MNTGNALIAKVSFEEMNFLKNWNAILARAEKHTQSIRILDGAATIITPTLILRSPRHRVNFPNGFYVIDANYTLVPDNIVLRTREKPYPDVECFKPEFPPPFGKLDTDTIQNLIVFLSEEINAVDTITLYKDSVASSTGRRFALPFTVTSMARVHTLSFKLALIEMLRYDGAYVARATGQPNAPVIIGHDWEKCAILAAQG